MQVKLLLQQQESFSLNISVISIMLFFLCRLQCSHLDFISLYSFLHRYHCTLYLFCGIEMKYNMMAIFLCRTQNCAGEVGMIGRVGIVLSFQSDAAISSMQLPSFTYISTIDTIARIKL